MRKQGEKGMGYHLPEQFQEFGEARRAGFLRVKELKESGNHSGCGNKASEKLMSADQVQLRVRVV